MSTIKLANGGKIELDHETGAVTFYPYNTVHEPGDLVGFIDEELVLDHSEPRFAEICELLATHFERWATEAANVAQQPQSEKEPAKLGASTVIRANGHDALPTGEEFALR